MASAFQRPAAGFQLALGFLRCVSISQCRGAPPPRLFAARFARGWLPATAFLKARGPTPGPIRRSLRSRLVTGDSLLSERLCLSLPDYF